MWMRRRFRDICQVSRNFLTRMIAITARLQDLAELTGRSKTFYMIEAIREHLDDLEDLFIYRRTALD
jgi:predicted DNA-binding protein